MIEFQPIKLAFGQHQGVNQIKFILLLSLLNFICIGYLRSQETLVHM